MNITSYNDFYDSYLDLSNGNIYVGDNNDFYNSTITISHPDNEEVFAELYNNNFDNDTTVSSNSVIRIEEYPSFLIDSNRMFYDAGRGIELFYAGWGEEGEHTISDNTIRLTGDTTYQYMELGIHSYFSNAQIKKNQILKNSYGIVGFHRSELSVIGDSLAEDISETQLIGDDALCQCLFNFASFPYEFHWNVILDTSGLDKPYIKAVEYDEFMQDTTGAPDWEGDPIFDVKNNCWINDTSLGNRLIPVGAYEWGPIWCPGESSGHELNEAGTAFYPALSDVENQDYISAAEGFKQVIRDFPGSIYAQASLKSLFSINKHIYGSSYSSFKNYCDSLSANPGDSLLGVSAGWLSIHCDIKDGFYQQAVNSLDSIITNPPSFEDSIYALIDLGYVYTKITDTTNQKSMLFSTHSDLIPKTHKKYVIQRDIWIEELLKSQQKEINPHELYHEDELKNITEEISSIYPNPALRSIDLDLEILKAGTYHVMLYSLTGQEILQTSNSYSIPGTYSIRQDISMVPAGIYFLVLQNNGAVLDSKKLVKSNE